MYYCDNTSNAKIILQLTRQCNYAHTIYTEKNNWPKVNYTNSLNNYIVL
jgi:hypothetical protein